MNKKSLLKTALVSATILSGAGLFANSAQAQAATSATHAKQVRGGPVSVCDRGGYPL